MKLPPILSSRIIKFQHRTEKMLKSSLPLNSGRREKKEGIFIIYHKRIVPTDIQDPTNNYSNNYYNNRT